MLIDPKGLLQGDRIGACSDNAQLHFPRILAASNGYGRFRMSVDWLHAEVYARFHTRPTKEQLTGWLREYHAQFLLFVYKAPDGAVWAQFEIPDRMRPRYVTAEDRRSPAPPELELQAFRASYVEMLRTRNGSDPDTIADGFHNVPQSSETFRKPVKTCETVQDITHGIGIGVGNGDGIGVGSSPAEPEHTEPYTDPRHIPFREAVRAHFRELNPDDECPWDGSEGKALAKLLKANPKLTVERLAVCLGNRAQSAVQASNRPRRWLETVTDYLSGPKDEYGKPLQKRPREPGTRRSVSNSGETREKMLRKEALEFWEDLKLAGSPRYDKDAPNWVRQELESRVS